MSISIYPTVLSEHTSKMKSRYEDGELVAREVHGEQELCPGRTEWTPLSRWRLMPHYWSLTLFLIIFIVCIGGSECIKINRFQVPEAVERGKPAVLFCNYSFDRGEELYSIKFYKNNVEFYRYVPGENSPKQSYKLKGIYVNVSASNATHAVLSRTNLNSDGLYICEISTEAPTFSTVRSEQLMKVYVLPDQSLQIHGVLDQYNYGDNISIICKSGKSWPWTKLQWFINGILVDDKYVTSIATEKSPSGLLTTKIGLNIYANPQYFTKGVLEIKCLATLTIVYVYETSERLVTGSFKNKSIDRFSSERKEWSLQPNLRTPVISGIKKNYRLKEMLNLNCSTASRNTELKWFIMNREVNNSHLVHYESSRLQSVLGLRLTMDKQLIQMPDLHLRCLSYFAKQISQTSSKLQIRTFDNQSWESSAIGSKVHCTLASTSWTLLSMMLLLYLF